MKVVCVNIDKIDYDGKLDRSCIPGEVTFYSDSSKTEFMERVKQADIIVTKEYVVSEDMIMQLPDRVKMICEAGTGYNNIDLEACRKRNIMVCNTPAYSTKRVAHTAIMLILMLASSMPKQLHMIHKKDHRNFTQHMMVEHMEVNDKILGIIGEGNIGKEVIKIAQALDMKILVYTRTPKKDHDGICYVSLEELLKQADFVSLHCPLTPDTIHIINKETLSLMKSTAFLINTSRGALIDEEALLHALQNKKIAGAGLDVQEVEPPREDHPFYEMDQVILTPHMGWRGLETRQRLLQLVSNTLNAYIEGHPINVIVNTNNM